MTTAKLGDVLKDEQKKQFDQDGYLLLEGLFAEEAGLLREHYMKLRTEAPSQFYKALSAEESGGDILKQYPRIMHPHRFDELSKSYMLHPALMNVLADLFGAEPLAAQSMLYFKPPGAKGQALHQDNFYLLVEPGTCIAAWVALDDADQDNGGMLVVPKSNALEVQCPHQADPAVSFTRDEVDVPQGYSPVPMNMKAGDVLFFNGSLIHGSYPNTSQDRFRRAFICHYACVQDTKISAGYKPLIRFDGSEHAIESNVGGGPCGTEFSSPGIH
ncbi:phytanoyl-CoA dioxygenase family protein [Paenibacillus nasutitermitis]|uniref:Protein involved in biosynthesis of mitomycin antibiotics/polyketide fumonisin n=1 Tax=Paenibacillus nasutitermitis TaxID=1652958 RepID=A0A916Z7P0_9BACL|nr:phytanoyl-CoA dioxygenase family protein [Paenibacillus nasutitermitis]GGD80579.1 protein involved in biosynthesis of mitomycin antibiotics/polyketide fumonisin [Paenibacillus nasutitermitis]